MTIKYRSTSNRRTPWDKKETRSPLEDFIRSKYLDSFEYKHPKLSDTSEAQLLNTYALSKCKYCESSDIQKYGFTKNKIQRYYCLDCHKTFSIITNTIFEDHKIAISEWIEFCLNIFRYESINVASKTNKNSFTTTKYWLHKLFLILSEIQNNILLEGHVQIDETYFPVMKKDRTIKNGKQLRGLSKDQYCIAIGYDGKQVYAALSGKGKPSQAKVIMAYSEHIKPGSTLIHDREKSHRILVKQLNLNEVVYDANEIKKLEDKDNPLKEVNHQCYLLKRFLEAHSGFDREDLINYIHLFCFIQNPPFKNLEKVEILLSSAIYLTKSLKFRELYAKK